MSYKLEFIPNDSENTSPSLTLFVNRNSKTGRYDGTYKFKDEHDIISLASSLLDYAIQTKWIEQKKSRRHKKLKYRSSYEKDEGKRIIVRDTIESVESRLETVLYDEYRNSDNDIGSDSESSSIDLSDEELPESRKNKKRKLNSDN